MAVRSAILAGLGRGRAEVGEGGLEVGVADPGQALAGRAAGGDGRQALFDVAAVLLEVPRDQRLDRSRLLGVEVAAGDEVLGQGPGLVAGPGLEGGDELALVDQAVLQGEQAEEQVSARDREVGGMIVGSRAGYLMPFLSGLLIQGSHGTWLRFGTRRADRIARESSLTIVRV